MLFLIVLSAFLRIAAFIMNIIGCVLPVLDLLIDRMIRVRYKQVSLMPFALG